MKIAIVVGRSVKRPACGFIATSSGSILNEIAMHAEANPNWLDLSAAL